MKFYWASNVFKKYLIDTFKISNLLNKYSQQIRTTGDINKSVIILRRRIPKFSPTVKFILTSYPSQAFN